MIDLAGKQVLVIGLGCRGRAAAEFLRRSGARVIGIDRANTAPLRDAVEPLVGRGLDLRLGTSDAPKRHFDFAVVNPGVASSAPILGELGEAGVPLIGELELGYQQSKCLTISIAGTNGKSTTAELVKQILLQEDRKALVAGHSGRPVCAVVEQSKDLDYLILQVNVLQLERLEFLRSAVSVLLNTAHDFQDRFPSPDDYARTTARVFQNQQPFDWAIVQSEALARLRQVKIEPKGKLVTFSATDESADLHFDRGLLVSRLDDWSGPLLNIDDCKLRGPHNAENLMAALAVGRALRIPLERMVETLKHCGADRHRFESVADVNGVEFINDSKATNLDALDKALRAVKAGTGGQPNVWLIAGGVDRGQVFHDIGPLLAKRVKGTFLLGEAAEKIRAAWGLFTPCTPVESLLEAVSGAAKSASPGDVVLFSPACSSFDQFRDYQDRGERFCAAVKTISRGMDDSDPNRDGRKAAA